MAVKVFRVAKYARERFWKLSLSEDEWEGLHSARLWATRVVWVSARTEAAERIADTKNQCSVMAKESMDNPAGLSPLA